MVGAGRHPVGVPAGGENIEAASATLAPVGLGLLLVLCPRLGAVGFVLVVSAEEGDLTAAARALHDREGSVGR